jgi:Icc-related predicted phosphoesterase
MARIVATGDLHIRTGDPGPVAPRLRAAARGADVLLIAGDITDHGRIAEAERARELLIGIEVPILAVLGNHDLRSIRRLAFRQILERPGVTVLDGSSAVITTECGLRIGFVGVPGCGGGFWPAEDPEAIHARAWNALAVRQRREAAKLDAALCNLVADVRIVLMHFAPTPSTLGSEPGAKYWMLGNGELGRVIDRHHVDLVIHGHAHLGSKAGRTALGTPVRNVAFPVNKDVVHLRIHGTQVLEASEVESDRFSMSA